MIALLVGLFVRMALAAAAMLPFAVAAMIMMIAEVWMMKNEPPRWLPTILALTVSLLVALLGWWT